MMNFITMTLCITAAIMLASGISVILITNKTVLKWYAKKVQRVTKEIAEEIFEDEFTGSDKE